ncbi:MAG: glycosyltransferase [Acidobacteriales bacterium]|nr:glycosyltransferase [Terriglobales bacterium]
MAPRNVQDRDGNQCNNMSLVTIVLPTYNGIKFLAEAIEGVVSQTYKNWELIIVDDGSTDRTFDIAARFSESDGRIKVIRNRENVGLPRSLNIGMKTGTGQLLTWTSDDNIYRPEAMSRMADYLHRNAGVWFVYADATAIDEEGQVLRPVIAGEPPELLRGNCIGACFLYRREVYRVVGDYDVCSRLAEDYEYWLRVSKHFRMAPLHEDLYLYRVHSDSLTELHREKARAVVGQALRRHAIGLPWATSEQRAECYLKLSRRAREKGAQAEAAMCFAMAMRCAPGLCVRDSLTRLGRRVLKLCAGTRMQ